MEQTIDLELEKKEILRRYRKLLTHAKPFLKDGDAKIIKKAFSVSADAHREMRRKSGEPYIYHPLEVAQICVEEIGLGTTSIVAALLHDVVEDSDEYELEDIEKEFGPKVAQIIDGLTKISGVFEYGTSQQAENFRKMVLTLSDDVRVILIKLADRLHNMRTLSSMPRHKQLKIASETIYLYAPLAHRLGLYAIKSELEDLYLKYTDPDTYYLIANKINESKAARNKFIKDFIKPIQSDLRKHYFDFVIKGRPKSIYSIWNKMRKQNIPFEKVYDLFAIRIILNTLPENDKTACWQVYSIVTDFYKPNPDRLRDWISTPKGNGYESLHTTVMSAPGKWVEVQIRTQRMDDIAEKGYAAHWKYKEKSGGESGLEQWIQRVRGMLSQSSATALEFMDEFRSNLFSEEVFVFTPKGELKLLPRGATALDFAFDIHTHVGLRCLGAKVNHKLVPISHRLKNGDQVEILTSEKQKPTEDWLKNVVTSKARKKIKDYLRENIKRIELDGKEIVLRKLKQSKIELNEKTSIQIINYFKVKNLNEFYIKIAKGIIAPSDIKKIKEASDVKAPSVPKEPHVNKEKFDKVKDINKSTLLIGDDLDEVDYSISKCCNPIPGDDVFGFVTVNEGIKIHKTNCPNAAELMSNYGYRIVRARWSNQTNPNFLAGLRISGTDRVGLLNDLTRVISIDNKVNIRSIQAETRDGIIEDVIMLYVMNIVHLNEIIESIESISGVISVERFEPNLE